MTVDSTDSDDHHSKTAAGAAFGSFTNFRKGDALAELNDQLVINGLWQRSGLSRRDRRLVTMAILATRGAFWEAGIHIRSSLANDELSVAELEEVAVQIAFYAGWPTGNQFQKTLGEGPTPE